MIRGSSSMVVVLHTTEPLLEKVGARGTTWRWRDTEADPLQRLFSSAVCDGCCQLEWSASQGRHAVTRRAVERGSLLLRVPALALVPLVDKDTPRLSAQALNDATAIGVDAATIALSMSLLQQPGASAVARSLLSHAAHLSASQRSSLDRLVQELRQNLCDTPAACFTSTDELGSLLLCVRSNAQRALDDETASRATGLGLYPAAALLNHSCAPSACVGFASAGQELQVRALVSLPAGAEVSVSYLSEEQLYAPWAERRALLRAAHHFEPSEPPERRETEATVLRARAAAAEKLSEGAAREEESRLERDLRRLVERAQQAEAAGDMRALEGGIGALLELKHGELDKRLHVGHWLQQEACAALQLLGRAVDDPGIVARYSLQLLSGREATLPRGTPHLAMLYAAHGGALCGMINKCRVPQAQRRDVGAQALAALDAAARIRETCFGEEHTITAATRAACERLRQRVGA